MDRLHVRVAPAMSDGETLTYLPLARRFGWIQMHEWVSGGLPCVGEGCALCSPHARPRRLLWFGYLPCLLPSATGAILLVAIRPDAWEACATLCHPQIDLRNHALELSCRRRGRGTAYRYAVRDACDRADLVRRQYPTLKQCLLSLWSLPEDQPDYRADVYFRWGPRDYPAVDAPVLNGLGVA